MYHRDEGVFVVDILHQSADVCQCDDVFCVECAGNLSCCCIGVDVVNIAFAVGANGGNDGDVTAVDGVYNGGGVDFGDVAYIAVITFQFFA